MGITMKIIVVLALAGLAMAEPEAYHPYHYSYQAAHAYRPNPYSPYSLTGHYYGKRDADAEADPQVILNNYGYGLHPSTLYNVPVVQKTVVKNAVTTPVVYNNLHSPLVYSSSLYPTVLSTPLVNAFPTLQPWCPRSPSARPSRRPIPRSLPTLSHSLAIIPSSTTLPSTPRWCPKSTLACTLPWSTRLSSRLWTTLSSRPLLA